MYKYLFLCLFFHYSCTSFTTSCKEKRVKRKMEYLECQQKWKSADLTKKQTVKVLYFNKAFRNSISFYPSLLIGVNQEFDTLAILDKTYPSPKELKQGTMIKVEVCDWSEEDKELYTLMGLPKVNIDIICSIDTIFYGRIEW